MTRSTSSCAAASTVARATTANKDISASQLLPTDLDDWCGDVSTYCFQCSGWGGTEKAFMKEAKKRWAAYAFKLAEKAQRIRTLKFDTLDEYYEQKMEGCQMQSCAR